MALPLAAFAATPEGKAIISESLGMVTKLFGGLFSGHSDWYYYRQHMYGWNINSSGDKAKEFGSDVFKMFRDDLKKSIAAYLQGDQSKMNSFADGGDWYLVAKAALPYQSQYFSIPQDDDLIKIACDLLAHGMLPTDNKTFMPPDIGGDYNKSWLKYQVDNVAAIAQLKQTSYWQTNYGSNVSSTVNSAVSTVKESVQSSINKLSSNVLEPKTDTSGNVVKDENGVIQYKTKSSVWVIVVIVASCIVCLGFVGKLFGKKRR